MLDLKKNDPAAIAEAGFEFNVVLPDGTETDAKIKVRGVNSPVVQAYAKRVYNERQMEIASYRRKNKEVPDLSVEEMEQIAAKNASVRIISWEGLGEGDKPTPYSPQEAERLLLAYPFLRTQVMEASDEIQNFRH